LEQGICPAQTPGETEIEKIKIVSGEDTIPPLARLALALKDAGCDDPKKLLDTVQPILGELADLRTAETLVIIHARLSGEARRGLNRLLGIDHADAAKPGLTERLRRAFIRLSEFAKPKTGDAEKTDLLRRVFENLCRDAIGDPEAIGRRAISHAMALDVPCLKEIPVAEMAERLSVSRQAVYAQVDKSAMLLAVFKEESQSAS
jgi:hypothetical protein